MFIKFKSIVKLYGFGSKIASINTRGNLRVTLDSLSPSILENHILYKSCGLHNSYETFPVLIKVSISLSLYHR